MTTFGAATWCMMFVVGSVALIGWCYQIHACKHHREVYRGTTHDYEGDHKWGPWSQPYQAIQHDSPSRRYGPPASTNSGFPWWQERRCQCGNRDFRPTKVPT